MIVAVGADKGSPGVTTLATALALTWPGPRLLVEADPSGGDLSMRTRGPGLDFLAREPTVLDFAMAVRSRSGGVRIGERLADFAQSSSAGVDVVAGPVAADGWVAMQNLWPQVAAAVAEWPGTVIVDLGRFQPGHPGLAFAEAADVVLLLTRPTMDGLLRTRDRALHLQQQLPQVPGPIPRANGRGGLGVVVRAGARDRAALEEVQRGLSGVTPVVGGFADDSPTAPMLWSGPDTSDLRATALVRSAHELGARVRRLWPDPRAHATPDRLTTASNRPAAAQRSHRQDGPRYGFADGAS